MERNARRKFVKECAARLVRLVATAVRKVTSHEQPPKQTPKSVVARYYPEAADRAKDSAVAHPLTPKRVARVAFAKEVKFYVTLKPNT